MATSKAQARALAKYVKKAYDTILIRLRKDSKYNGDFIKSYADSRGESINGFIARAIRETIANDSKGSDSGG